MRAKRNLARIAGGAVAFVCLFGGVSQAGSGPRDLTGMWWIKNYDPIIKPADGSAVPYTAAGQAAYDSNIAQMQNKDLFDKSITRCLPQGLPRAMLSAFPLKIVEHERSLTFIHEENHTFWHAVIGATHKFTEDDERAFMGAESVARWDGNTLVIDTVGFKPASFLDQTGVPHTDQLHTIQRLRKINNGKELEAMMTVEDPTLFTKSWTVKRTYEWRPDVKLMEYVCGEPHRVLTGERAKAIRLNWVAP